MYKMQKKKWK